MRLKKKASLDRIISSMAAAARNRREEVERAMIQQLGQNETRQRLGNGSRLDVRECCLKYVVLARRDKLWSLPRSSKTLDRR